MQTAPMIIPDLRIDGERLRADFDTLAEIGATSEGGISRLALSQEDILARIWFGDRIEDAGLLVHEDDAGNISGVLRCGDPGARTLMLGSHLDSVPDGGRFDGAVGVLAALECLRTIKEACVQLPFHLEAIDFTDDEGTWQSLLGSRAVAGLLALTDFDDALIEDGAFRAAMARAGISEKDVHLARRDPETICGYLELHTEQGNRLERSKSSIGVVTGIVGRSTYEVKFFGQAGHSGTTDMYKRRDALRGAALFITRAHEIVRQRYGDGIFNCGNIDVKPGAYNIIPSLARLTVEVRHIREHLLAEMETLIAQTARECAIPYGLTVDTQRIVHMPAAAMSEPLIRTIEQAADKLQLSHMRLASYAGHDAQMMATIAPTAMIFVPSKEGIGHHPDEFSEWDDVVNGANVLLQTVLNLAAQA